MQKKLKVLGLNYLFQFNKITVQDNFLFNIFENILIGTTSVFNYVSLIVDALSDKLPGFEFSTFFFVSGRG